MGLPGCRLGAEDWSDRDVDWGRMIGVAGMLIGRRLIEMAGILIGRRTIEMVGITDPLSRCWLLHSEEIPTLPVSASFRSAQGCTLKWRAMMIA